MARRQREQPGPEIKSASAMLAEAESLLREGRAEDALPVALRALDVFQGAVGRDATTTAALPALNAVAEIYLELGDAATARSYFLQAVTLDPTGQIPSTQGGGAEKFLYLAQLSDDGGQDSVAWFSQGAAILRREIATLSSESQDVGGKRKKLAEALCGIIEVYMTDLSWDPTAETQCESLISEALLVAPHSAEPLQTLASIRISQARIPEAKTALRESMAIWAVNDDDEDSVEPEPEDDDDGQHSVPDFATRVSLARLLMEVEMEEEALGVVERLVQEDDGSVESWYLGGWCLYLLAGRKKFLESRNGAAAMVDVNGIVNENEGKNNGEEEEEEADLYTQSLTSSREWLRQSLNLYDMIEYEDERLKDHAMELVRELDAIIGERGDDDGIDGEEWNGFEEEEDEEQEEEEEEDEEMMDDG